MSIFNGPEVGDDGWTDWVQPKHAKYKILCCDCGLVHEMQFRVVKDTGRSKFCDIEDKVKGLVVFRVKRDNRATANVRRTKKKR
jgi:hypothetical protein